MLRQRDVAPRCPCEVASPESSIVLAAARGGDAAREPPQRMHRIARTWTVLKPYIKRAGPPLTTHERRAA